MSQLVLPVSIYPRIADGVERPVVVWVLPRDPLVQAVVLRLASEHWLVPVVSWHWLPSKLTLSCALLVIVLQLLRGLPVLVLQV